jgi:hypothetical protein
MPLGWLLVWGIEMSYQFLSRRTINALAKAFGEDFDLFALASRPRRSAKNIHGETYLASHLDLWFAEGVGPQGRFEIVTELAAQGFAFTDELRRGRWKGFLTEKQLCRVRESLVAGGYRCADVERAIAVFQARVTGQNKKSRRRARLERAIQRLDRDAERMRAELAILQAEDK